MTDPRPDQQLFCIVRLDARRDSRINSARFTHRDAARRQARRLAREAPGATFAVMAVVEVIRPGDDLLQSELF